MQARVLLIGFERCKFQPARPAVTGIRVGNAGTAKWAILEQPRAVVDAVAFAQASWNRPKTARAQSIP
jgi:hypothetical protein